MIAAASTRRTPRKAPWQVWRDASGNVSALRVVALAFLLVPVLVAVYDFQTEGFGARPINNVIHRTGYWALIFLLTALAITPLRRIARFNPLIDVRRMIGVGAFVYAFGHISLFFADQMYDVVKFASEIAKRVYLIIGFTALTGLAVLAATSTDGMVRRLGSKRWQRLHQAIYGIALLALIHYFQQTKADVSVPTFVAGLFGWMIGYRLLIKWRATRTEPPTWQIALLSVAIAALTFICEAVGIAIVFNTSPLMVLQSAFDFDFEMIETNRPGWFVLAAGLVVVAVDLVRSYAARPPRSAARPVPVGERASEVA
jgi:sulfoxide reductase heme-binding subunit YedZ